jgi:protein gp37
MKRFPQPKLHLDEKELKTNLGKGNFIFVGSSCDMFAKDVPDEWIKSVLTHCLAYSDNKYLFQSKNPERMYWFYSRGWFPPDNIVGTTIETNWNNNLSKAPQTDERVSWMIHNFQNKMVSIEPIVMPIDVDVMVDWIKQIKPKFVSIGADSKGHNLPEPSWDKVQSLIKELKKFAEVKVKDNLRRLEVSGNSSHG